jgi:predicted TIM-barrel fold metal-dependent hydrolase
MAGADRLIFGSDWPFAARLYSDDGEPQPALREAFDADLRQKIERQTAVTHLDALNIERQGG